MDFPGSTPIFIIEDDYLQSKTLTSAFQERYQNREVRVFDSEASFRLGMKAVSIGDIPSLVVCDVMLPWALPGDPEPDKRPDDVDEPTGYIKAGNRCYQFARDAVGSSWKKVPWLFHTVLTKDEMQFEETVGGDKLAHYIGKDVGLEDLLIKVDKMLFDLSPESEDETRFFTENPVMYKLLREGLAVKTSEGLPSLANLTFAPI